MELADDLPRGVSVCCNVYNQARYIEQTLDSFLAQECEFPFEVLVHDDCSTDGTVDILRSYELKYPDIVRVVYEEENQWGPDARYISGKLLPIARYRYFAMCEGDDLWCDEGKLQRQVDYLDAHPDCALSVHQARIVNAVTGEELGLMGYGPEPLDVDAEYVLRHWASPIVIPSASWVARRSTELAYEQAWTFPRPVGDICRATYYAEQGYVHHDPMVACIYRSGVVGSASADYQRSAVDPGRELAMARFYRNIDEHTENRYHEILMRKGASCARTVGAVVGLRRFFSSDLGKPYRPYLSRRDKVLGFATRMLILAGRVPAYDFEKRRYVQRKQTPEEREAFARFRSQFAREGGEA